MDFGVCSQLVSLCSVCLDETFSFLNKSIHECVPDFVCLRLFCIFGR